MAKFKLLEMEGKIIEFLSSDGYVLNGALVEPKRRSTNPKTCVIYLHGLRGTFYSSHLLKYISAELAERGTATLSIETRGSYFINDLDKAPTSRKKKNNSTILCGGSIERFEDCTKDISGAVAEAHKRGYKRILLAGHSTGCQKISYYAHKTKGRRIAGLVVIAPMEDKPIYEKILGRRFAATVSEAKRLSRQDPNAILPKSIGVGFLGAKRFVSLTDTHYPESMIFNYLSGLKQFGSIRKPVLAILAGADQYAQMPAAEYASRLQKSSSAGNVSVSIVPGANHGFLYKEKDAAKAILSWMDSLDW